MRIGGIHEMLESGFIMYVGACVTGCFSRSLSSGQISMYDRASDASVKAHAQVKKNILFFKYPFRIVIFEIFSWCLCCDGLLQGEDVTKDA